MQVLFVVSKISSHKLRKDRERTEGCIEDFRKDTEPVHKKSPLEIRFEGDGGITLNQLRNLQILTSCHSVF